MQPHHFGFDWDPAKAAANLAKHKIPFEDAMDVFLDPLALSQPDTDSTTEERWVTVGVGRGAKLLLVVHTHLDLEPGRSFVRIISVRKPNNREKRQYEQSAP